MIEVSEFQIGLSLNTAKFIEDLDKIAKAIQEKLLRPLEKNKSLSETIAESANSIVSDINVILPAIAALFAGMTNFEALLAIITIVLTVDEFLSRLDVDINRILDLFKEDVPDPIDIEKNLAAQEKIFQDIIAALVQRKELREQLGDENFFKIFGKFPSDDLSLEQIMESFQPVLNVLKSAREELELIKSLIDIAKSQGAELEFSPSKLEIPSDLLKELLESQELSPELGKKILDFINKNQQLNDELERGKEIIGQYGDEFGILEGTVAMAGKGLVAGAGAQKEYAEQTAQAEKTLDSYGGTTKDVTNKTESLDKEVVNQTQNIGEYKGALEQTDTAAQNFGENGLGKVKEGAEEANKALSDIDLSKLLQDFSPEEIAKITGIPIEKIIEQAEMVGVAFEKASGEARESLDELGVFAADIAAEINDTFADLIFRGLKGNLDSLSDLWDSTLDAMLDTFAQFAATIISNPIRILLDAVLRGESGSGGSGGGKGFFGTLGSVFDIGQGFKTIGKGLLKIPGVSSIVDSITGLFAEGGPLAGIGSFLSSALPVIGAIASVVAFAVPLLSGLFEKKPRLDLDFDTFRDEFGKSLGIAAEVKDFLDKELFLNDIFNTSVSRSAGLGLKGRAGEVIQEAIEGTIETIQEIIFQLPADLAEKLNEVLLNTPVDIETKIKGDRLLEFDETKKIAEKFQQFIEGDLQARFVASIGDFFVTAFESLGVMAENAEELVSGFIEDLQGANREQRIELGQEFLATFQAFVDAFNIVEGNVNDAIGTTINNVNNLARTLGFDAVPSIEELRTELGKLIESAELDPETVQNYVELRNAIVSLTSEIVSSISSLIGKISQLNGTIAGFGGSAVDLTGFLNTAIDSVQDFLGANIENLSLSEQEGLLDELLGLANQLLAEEQAAFQAQVQAQQAALDAQRSAIEARIDGLEEEKERIREAFDERIDALNEELRIAEDFASLTESIRKTLDSILFSPESVLTGVEQVTGGLTALAELTESRGRSVEEINAEIERLTDENNKLLESIDAQIESAQAQLAAIGEQTAQNTFQASERLRELFEFIRSEYIRILEERFAQLEEISDTGFATEIEGLQAIADIGDEQLTVLKSIETLLESVQGFAEGTGGLIRDFGRGTLAVLHGREAVLTESQLVRMRAGLIEQFVGTVTGPGLSEQLRDRIGGGFTGGLTGSRSSEEGAVNEMHVDINVNVNGGSRASAATLGNEIENMLVRSIRQGGRLRSAIQEAGARRLN